MDEVLREQVKQNFQADPATDPVRILIATDAASEGIDLQRHCRRMVHLEIPWNPNRLEQRNGRIDRHLQPYPQVFIGHFVPAGYDDAAAAASLADDLEFLARVVRKVEQIREDLGSVGQVLSDQVSEAMLGRRRRLDDSALMTPRSLRAKRQLAALERNLRERFAELHAKLNESRAELGLSAEAVERAVNVGLALGRQSPLEPVEIAAKDGYPAVRGFVVPQLTRSWASASDHLYHPKHGQRPITFDHAAAGRDDVVLEHLGSRLVAQSLRLLRAQIWSTRSDARLSRGSARVVNDPAVTDLTVVAHARIVVTGGDGRRLHEEVIYAGGRVRGGRFAREETLARLREQLAAPAIAAVSPLLEQQIEGLWPTVRVPLFDALQARATTRFDAMAKRLARSSTDEQQRIAELLTELQQTIRAELAKAEPELGQLLLDLPAPERDQMQADLDALRRRLDAIPDEITREQALIAGRYAEPHPLMFPAAVTVIVPRRLANDLGGAA